VTKREKLIIDLFKNKCIDFGKFKLKSGITSPVYIDIRKLVSYPSLMKKCAAAYWQTLKKLNFDRIAGVPYAALPIASVISVEYKVPMVYMRKEKQDHGITKLIQGEYKKGEKVVVIDDIVTTSNSKFIAIKPLEKSGLKVKDVLILLDREQGGKSNLKAKGYNLYSIFMMTEALDILKKYKKITKKKYQEVINYLKDSKKKLKTKN